MSQYLSWSPWHRPALDSSAGHSLSGFQQLRPSAIAHLERLGKLAFSATVELDVDLFVDVLVQIEDVLFLGFLGLGALMGAAAVARPAATTAATSPATSASRMPSF